MESSAARVLCFEMSELDVDCQFVQRSFESDANNNMQCQQAHHGAAGNDSATCCGKDLSYADAHAKTHECNRECRDWTCCTHEPNCCCPVEFNPKELIFGKPGPNVYPNNNEEQGAGLCGHCCTNVENTMHLQASCNCTEDHYSRELVNKKPNGSDESWCSCTCMAPAKKCGGNKPM